MKERLNSIDTLRSFLIVLVIFGHLLEGFWRTDPEGNALIKTVWVFIYFFHIPAFAFVSGYLSGSGNIVPDIKKLFYSLVLPYVFFQILYRLTAYRYNYIPAPSFHFFSEPYVHLWYLTALFFWRILLPVFISIRYSFVLVFSLGLFSIFMPDAAIFLSLGRTLRFFPYFFLGAVIAGKDIRPETFQNIPARFAAVTALVISMCAAFLFQFGGDENRVLYQFPAEFNDAMNALFHHLRIYILGFALSLSLFILSFSLNINIQWITGPGRYSLYPYILHVFFVIYFLNSRIPAFLNHKLANDLLLAPVLFLVSAASAFLLSTKAVRKITEFLIQPRAAVIEKYGMPAAFLLTAALLSYQFFIH